MKKLSLHIAFMALLILSALGCTSRSQGGDAVRQEARDKLVEVSRLYDMGNYSVALDSAQRYLRLEADGAVHVSKCMRR